MRDPLEFLVVAVASMAIVALAIKAIELVGGFVIDILKDAEGDDDWLEESAQQERQDIHRLNSMDTPSAQQQALALLADPNRFYCTMADGPPLDNAFIYPASVKSLFTTYQEIGTRRKEVVLRRPSSMEDLRLPGYCIIGHDEDGSPFLARPIEDTIYHRAFYTTDIQPYASTVYHWVLIADYLYS